MISGTVCLGYHWTDPPVESGQEWRQLYNPTELIFDAKIPRTTDPLRNGWGYVPDRKCRFSPTGKSIWLCPSCVIRFRQSGWRHDVVA